MSLIGFALKILLISILSILLALLIVRIRLRMLKDDYFVREDKLTWWQNAMTNGPIWATLLRNAVGFSLILMGIVLLFTPGPGGAMIFAGVTFADFPGKRYFERWVVRRPLLFHGINRLRCRAWSLEKRDDLNPFIGCA